MSELNIKAEIAINIKQLLFLSQFQRHGADWNKISKNDIPSSIDMINQSVTVNFDAYPGQEKRGLNASQISSDIMPSSLKIIPQKFMSSYGF